jgi:regulator of protease activity HflC (stomatin/prohibitin superfamily)
MIAYVIYAIGISLFWGVLYLSLRLGFSALAQKNILVTTIKNGRIKFVTGVKNGGVVRFLANLENLNYHINEESGLIFTRKEKWYKGNRGSLFWKIFKVRWIGLCHVYTYDFPKMYVDGTTKEDDMVKAESIFFRSAYIIIMENVEALGTISFKIKIRVIVEVANAAKTISLGKDWPSYFVNPTKAAVISVVGKSEPLELLNKTGIDSVKAEIITSIINDTSSFEYAGLEIKSVDITDIDPSDDKTRKILESKKTEEIEGDARKIKAEKELAVAEVEKQKAIVDARGKAQAVRELGEAEAAVITEKVKALGNKGENLVGYETAKAIATAQPKVLSIGKGGVGTIVQAP